jgi:dymeclin
LLAKKRTKIINSLNVNENPKTEPTELQEQPSQQSESATSTNGNDYIQDLAIIEELMRMVLEIVNSCLTNNLHHNSNLIYSLLYHKNIYLQYRDHPSFHDVIQNIDTVITSFSHDIDNLEDKSIENLKEIIEFGVKQFSRDRFRVIFLLEYACRSFPSFRPRFASKCDRQSSDLTQDFSNPYSA